MGGREVGGLAHLLPGYRSVLDPQDRAEVATLWGVPPEHLSPRPGYSAVELFHALAEGKVKAVWILCTNPAVSMPDLDLVEKGLRQAELVVVQDAYHPTDTTRFADVLLPAAQWPEKEGVMTNSERTLTYLPRLVDPPGETLPDWQILTSPVSRTPGSGGGRCSGRARRRTTRGRPDSTPTGAFPPPTAAPASSPWSMPTRWSVLPATTPSS
jgi:anaerobic selenocysteine-containing dehydrogenase